MLFNEELEWKTHLKTGVKIWTINCYLLWRCSAEICVPHIDNAFGSIWIRLPIDGNCHELSVRIGKINGKTRLLRQILAIIETSTWRQQSVSIRVVLAITWIVSKNVFVLLKAKFLNMLKLINRPQRQLHAQSNATIWQESVEAIHWPWSCHVVLGSIPAASMAGPWSSLLRNAGARIGKLWECNSTNKPRATVDQVFWQEHATEKYHQTDPRHVPPSH